MDFITRLPRTLKGYTVIWVVIDRLTKSAHFIPGKSTNTATKFWKGLQLALDTRLDFSTAFHPQTNGQTERLRLAWHRLRLRMVGVIDLLYVGVKLIAHMKDVLRFEKKGKLSPRFVRSFEILERNGPVAYRLTLSPAFSAVHDVLHVSMLRKYVADSTHVVDFEPLHINENLDYEKQPVEILAREVKMLRNTGIALVKVLFRNHEVEEPHGRESMT
ncbi:uncharacterized protein LOC107991506 [Cucumis melo]|uniref:Uncharacterized protein LOC107991506 n=1 Tax=Cucumis melo TaxID=3656 RepID=A0A1S4E1C8_CUCME|nr:uncharacterized protein LOC107991506 [Cucumis melo]